MRSNRNRPILLEENANKTLKQYISILRIEAKSKNWQKNVEKWLNDFVESVDVYDTIAVTEYIGNLQKQMHLVSFKKQFYQIRRYLKFINQDYLNSVRLPRTPLPKVKIVTSEDVNSLIKFFAEKDKKHFLRCKAFILVLSTSGMRTKEAMQLTRNDIDLENNRIFIRCDSTHTQKIGQERVVFITDKAKYFLEKYIKSNKNRRLFNESTLTRAFNNAPFRMKMLRKYFSQEWVRRGGNQIPKEILMGHSLNNSVDGAYYCAMSEQDLKKIYDTVMK